MNDSVSFSNRLIQLPRVLGANTGWILVVIVMTDVVINIQEMLRIRFTIL